MPSTAATLPQACIQPGLARKIPGHTMRHFFGFCAIASGPKVATVFPAPRKPVRIVTGTCRAKLATEGKGDSTHKNHLLPIILQQASCNSPIAGIPPCLQTRLLLRAIRLHFCKLAGRHAAGGWLMMAWICGAITGLCMPETSSWALKVLLGSTAPRGSPRGDR